MVRIILLARGRYHWCFVVVNSKRNHKIIERIGFLDWVGNKFKVCLNVALFKCWMSRGALLSNKIIKLLSTFGVL
ncbi:30S ribosomal protein S16 [Candidatus Hodgkinia cicadicola]|uniref:30S ribosomal protein S16 n=1 Tax=Candidatus Hodgkinia cicadicola TaxID=573658 RepID=A0ABX4MHQ4_9HYPH|nr:30S ribosomal protein S16 [Candidatus Hodgkinia cicadicola]